MVVRSSYSSYENPVAHSACGFIMVKCIGCCSYNVLISIEMNSNPEGNGARADCVVKLSSGSSGKPATANFFISCAYTNGCGGSWGLVERDVKLS